MNYSLVLIDLSYLISRNIFSISTWKKPGEYTPGDVAKSVFQTVSKLFKDYKITASKVVFLSDSWAPEYSGYYRSWVIRDLIEYKGDRECIRLSDVDLESLSPEEQDKVKAKAYMNAVKIKAKKLIINNFGKFGIPTISWEGWEADDLAWLSSNLLYDMIDEKCLLVTKDSDWKYLLSPKMDYFVFPKVGNSVEIITHDDMYKSLPKEIQDKNISLYNYYSYINSLGDSHNNMKVTKRPRVNVAKTVIKILSGDYSNVADMDGFNLQLSTFDLTNFPGYSEVSNLLKEKYFSIGHIGTSEEFSNFCNENNIYGLSENYYLEFIGNLNSDYYKD